MHFNWLIDKSSNSKTVVIKCTLLYELKSTFNKFKASHVVTEVKVSKVLYG